jgi:dephospho-CoA kinase
MKLIGVTGFARSGKDTVGQILVREHNYVRFAFADPIKKMIADMLEMPLHKLEELKDQQLVHLDGLTPRYLMQTLGTEWGRDMIHKDLWVRLLREKIVLHADVRRQVP